MPLVPFKELLNKAIKGRYMIGYFESWDQYSLEAVIEAAEEENSPVIIGFGGCQMNQEWFTNKGLEELASLGRVVAEKSKVPVSYILNEVKEFKHIGIGIKNGFNVVMMDTSYMPLKENIKITKEIVKIAHKNKVSVEAELGRLQEGDEKPNKNFLTDPDEAEYFVKETNIDALSVSIGNVHVKLKGKSKIGFERLKRIKEKVKIPIAIHGGTGFSRSDIKKCRELGVAKFNVGTILKKEFLEGIKEAINKIKNEENIQTLIGSRKNKDIFIFGKKRMKNTVKLFLKYIKPF